MIYTNRGQVLRNLKFNATQLKYIAIIAMTIDHLAWLLYPGLVREVVPVAMHIIGRLTAPIMWYFIAEGCYYTKNIKKYFLRLMSFAVASHFAFCFGLGIPFNLMVGSIFNKTSVLFPLAMAVLLIAVFRNEKINLRKRVTSSGVKLKEENNFNLLDEMLRKISEKEGVKIYSYFKFKLYRYLLKKEKANNEISYENYEPQEYTIAEDILKENILEYQVKKILADVKESEKIKVAIVYDLENIEISKNIENLRKISELMDIIRIYRFDEFKREQSNSAKKGKKDNFDQILIVSNDEIQNTVINYSDKPISFLKLSDRENDGKKKSKFKKNAEFYNDLKIIDDMMKEYEKMYCKEIIEMKK